MDFLRSKFKIWWLQAVYSLVSGGFSLLYIYFVKQQISFFYILMAEFCGLVIIVIYLVCGKILHSRYTIMAGYLLLALSALVMLLPFKALYLVFFYFILSWLAAIIFFTPYNILYFQKIQKGEHLQDITFYWAVGIVVGIFAPLLAAYVWQMTNLSVFLTIYTLFIIFSLFLLNYIPAEVYRYKIKEGLTYLKGLRTINMIDGALHRTNGIIILIFSLQYINNELDFGKFLSITGLVALFVAFPMAKLSDQKQKRTIFIWPISVATGLVVMSFYFVNSFWQFFVLALILKGLLVLSEPIRSNIVLDKKEKRAITWISREIYLNIGRVLLVAVLVVMLYFGWFKETFIVMGALHLLFPVVVYFKKVYAPVAIN